jgi:hypothetical protein
MADLNGRAPAARPGPDDPRGPGVPTPARRAAADSGNTRSLCIRAVYTTSYCARAQYLHALLFWLSGLAWALVLAHAVA